MISDQTHIFYALVLVLVLIACSFCSHSFCRSRTLFSTRRSQPESRVRRRPLQVDLIESIKWLYSLRTLPHKARVNMGVHLRLAPAPSISVHLTSIYMYVSLVYVHMYVSLCRRVSSSVFAPVGSLHECAPSMPATSNRPTKEQGESDEPSDHPSG